MKYPSKYPSNTVKKVHHHSVIVVDDGCYAIMNYTDGVWRFSRHVFQEAVAAMRDLPENPRDAAFIPKDIALLAAHAAISALIPRDSHAFTIEGRRISRDEEIETLNKYIMQGAIVDWDYVGYAVERCHRKQI